MSTGKKRAYMRGGILLSFVAGGLSLCAPAFAQSLGAQIDREISLLSAPEETPLYGAVELLNSCRRVGIGTFSLCSIPGSVPISRGVPKDGLDRLFVTSQGTEVVVEATVSTPGLSVDVQVNGARCTLTNGTTACPVPVSSGSELTVDLFPSVSGENNVLAGSVMRVSSIYLRRGYESVLTSLRTHADSLERSLTSDMDLYSRFEKQVRYQGKSKRDLERVFVSLTTEHIPPLPDYNKPIVGADGKITRNTECPLKPSADPDTWSHSPEECNNLAIVTAILNGEPIFSQADIDSTRARIESNGASLGKVANALAANNKPLDDRFENLLARLRAKGIQIP